MAKGRAKAQTKEKLQPDKVKSQRRAVRHVRQSNKVSAARMELRELRAKAHAEFDLLWVHKLLTRDDAYLWLSRQLDVSRDKAHISLMRKKELKWLISRAPRHYKKLSEKRLKGKYKNYTDGNSVWV